MAVLLNEIFDTNNRVTWVHKPDKSVGTFEVDGEEYHIDVEDYDLDLPSGRITVADFGFRKGDSHRLTGDNKPGRIIGSVASGLREYLKTHKVDALLFSAQEKNGSVDDRKRMYGRAASLLSKTTEFNRLSDWFDWNGGSTMLMSKVELTPGDVEEVRKTISIADNSK